MQNLNPLQHCVRSTFGPMAGAIAGRTATAPVTALATARKLRPAVGRPVLSAAWRPFG